MAAGSPAEPCSKYQVVGVDALEEWALRTKASHDAQKAALHWLETAERVPDLIPYAERIVMGRRERTVRFPDANLVISYMVEGPPICAVAIIDARALNEPQRGE